MAGRAPVRKVKAGGLAAAASTLLVWALDTIPGLDLPAVVAAAITTLVGGLAAYQTSPAPGPDTAGPPPDGGDEGHATVSPKGTPPDTAGPPPDGGDLGP